MEVHVYKDPNSHGFETRNIRFDSVFSGFQLWEVRLGSYCCWHSVLSS